MRVALYSDIHGNTLGLQAVLAALDSLGCADIVYAAGDLLGGGSGTEEVLNLLLENRVRLLRGNGEEYVVDLEAALRREPEEWRRRYLGDIARWVTDRLSPAYVQLLRGLPLTETVEFGLPADV